MSPCFFKEGSNWRGAIASALLLTGLSAWPVLGREASLAVGRVRSFNNELLRVHAAAAQGNREQLRAEAAQLIEARAAALRQLTEEEPEQALALAFSPDLLAELGKTFPEAAARLEAHGTWQGALERWVFDSADLKTSRTVNRMRVGQQDVELHFTGAGPALKNGDLLQATGVLVGDQLAVAGSTTVATATTPACSSTGTQNTAALLVTFPGVALPAGVTQQSVSDIFFGKTGHSMDGYLQEASYGQPGPIAPAVTSGEPL